MASKMPKGKKSSRIDFSGFMDFAKDLDNINEKYLRKAVENALVKTKDYLNNETLKAMDSSKFNFKADGASIESLFEIENMSIEWNGYICKAFVGVDLSKAPQTLILAVKGSPRQAPDRKIYNAMKGKGKTKKQVEKIQEEEFYKVIWEGLIDG